MKRMISRGLTVTDLSNKKKALELRRTGMSFADIAKTLSITPARAYIWGYVHNEEYERKHRPPPLSDNVVYAPRVKVDVRSEVLRLHANGTTIRKIQELTGVDKSTVWRILHAKSAQIK